MSRTVDNRVVQMNFDNKQFESGVKTTMGTLADLKKGLQFDAPSKGISNIAGLARMLVGPLTSISSGIEHISSRFNVMGVIASTVISNMTRSIMEFSSKALSSLTAPIKQGLSEYETQINAIQTIMANTSAKGTTLEQVNNALDQLNEYSDKTIYNFTEMAKNIGTFTAAGVDLETSVAGIKGIANLAAVSGSTSQQAATAMYQLSQALSSGTVKLMDWNSVVNAGMGGEVFQNALKETARVSGIAIDEIIEKNGSFRESLQEGWLTSEVLTKTLAKFTGDLNEEQLKAMGYTEEQIAGIIKLGQTANDAASKVKTFSQLKGTIQESIVSGWAQSWRILVGDFEEAKSLFTEISDTIGPIIQSSSDARNSILQSWKDWGGRTMLIESLRNAFQGILSIAKPITDAFSSVFPPATLQTLKGLTLAIFTFSKGLNISGDTANRIKSIFKGLFAALDIVRLLFSTLFTSFMSFLAPVGAPAGNSVLGFLANIGDYLSNLRQAIKVNDIFGKAVQVVGNYLGLAAFAIGILIDYVKLYVGIVAKELGKIKDAFTSTSWFIGLSEGFSSFFENIKTSFISFNPQEYFVNIFNGLKDLKTSLSASVNSLGDIEVPLVDGLVERIKARFSPVGEMSKSVGSSVDKAFDSFGESISKSLSKGYKFVEGIGNFIGSIFKGIKDAISKIDLGEFKFDSAFDAINTAMAGGLFVGIMRFINEGTGMFESIKEMGKSGTGFIDSIKDVFNGVTDTLSAMQQKLKADVLIKIAAAIAILALSLFGLSLVDSEKMTQALIALTVLFTNLFAAMAVYEKTTGVKGTAKIAKAVIGMIGVSLAMLALVQVVKILADMDQDKLVQGIIGFTAIMLQMIVLTLVMKKVGPDSEKTALGIGATALAMIVIVKAIKKLADLEWEELWRGLTGITIIFTEIAVFTKVMEKSKVSTQTGVALIAVAFAIDMLSRSVEKFGNMKPEVLIQGLQAMGVMLGELALFLKITGNNKMLISTAIALGILALSLQLFVAVIDKLGNMDLGILEQGLKALGITLGLIAIALNTFPKDMLVKAVGLVLIAGALFLIQKVLSNFGGMKWDEIGRGLVALGGSMLILALGLGAMTGSLAGAAALLVAAAALTILVPVLQALGGMSLGQIGLALLALAGTFLVLGVAGYLLGPVVPILFGLAGAMALIAVASVLFGVAVSVLAVGLSALALSGVAGATALVAMVQILLGLIPIIITAIMNGIITFAQLIIDAAPVVGKAIFTVMNTILQVIIDISPKLMKTLSTLLKDLLQLIRDVVPDFIDTVLFLLSELLRSIAEKIPDFVQSGFDILIGFLKGIRDNIKEVVTVAIEIVTEFIDGVAEKIDDVIQSGVDLIIAFIDGLAKAVKTQGPALNTAIGGLATAIIQALSDGIMSGVGGVVKAISSLAGSAVQALKTLLGIFSPSRVFRSIANEIPAGIVLGIQDYAYKVVDATKDMGEKAIYGMSGAISKISDMLDSNLNANPTIRPVMDLSEIISGTNKMDSLLSKSAYGISPVVSNIRSLSNIGADIFGLNAAKNGLPTVSLVQNNYSPKALSRIEIYRQTKNQLATLKGLV